MRVLFSTSRSTCNKPPDPSDEIGVARVYWAENTAAVMIQPRKKGCS